jgi:WD40 repeat protein
LNPQVYDYNSPIPDIPLPKHSLLSTGTYTTSSLTQCTFLSSKTVLTTGTDGHAIFWPLPSISMAQSSSKLPYTSLTRIHQSSSKVLTSLILPTSTTLLISGGDDGSLSFLLSALTEQQEPIVYVENQHTPVHPPTVLVRAHASAITACVAFLHQSRVFVVTSGNDQWVRVWEVVYNSAAGGGEEEKDSLEVRRVRKVKTNVADVSSMALLGSAGIGEAEGGEGSESGGSTRVLICGVGMEVIRLEWEKSL